jgi:hypothetical protein
MLSHSIFIRRKLSLTIATMCLVSFPVLAADHHHADAPTQLSGVPSTKLATDETLRAGMTNVAELMNRWEAIPRAQPKTTDYAELAQGVRKELSNVIAKCKLPPASDNAFHAILKDLNSSLDLMVSPRLDLQKTGALGLKQALRNYGRYFDHPGWKVD